ncbi:carbon storage regulator [Novipirellula sp. SH528]|uniref:carbon storage regulator n=1 Tax=Novipirellula sp. SH528 TaxID=3454466 RepID=UPI003FA07DB7
MLVLARKVGERIQVGDDVVVTVTAIKGNRIHLGIDAPQEISIRRGELLEFAPSFADPATNCVQGTTNQQQIA